MIADVGSLSVVDLIVLLKIIINGVVRINMGISVVYSSDGRMTSLVDTLARGVREYCAVLEALEISMPCVACNEFLSRRVLRVLLFSKY